MTESGLPAMKKYQNVIVGAGITGAVLARLLAEQGQHVLILDKRAHVAGNCYDYLDEDGIYIHQYGPHIFRTDSDKIWQFLSRFTTWQPYQHIVRAQIDGQCVPIPFNYTSIEKLFPPHKAKQFTDKLTAVYGVDQKVSILQLQKSKDADIQELAEYIYRKVFYDYTAKQWGENPENLDDDVLSRVPVYTGYYDGYFTEKYQAIPALGYTRLVENILQHPHIQIKLNTDFKDLTEVQYERLFYTGSIDEFFNYQLGVLPYRSLSFELKTLPQEWFQEVAVVNYPGKQAYTRITEFKHFLQVNTPRTTIAYEYPAAFEVGHNERFYPIPTEENEKLYHQYLSLASRIPNIYFLGRLGAYKYYNMQSAILDVFKFFDTLALK